MGRIRVIGTTSKINSDPSREPIQRDSGKGIRREDYVPFARKGNKRDQVDFPLTRKKVKLNSRIKRALIKFYQEKTLTKRNRILQLRREKLEKYRIDYMPLCLDEDLEKLAAALAKDSRK